MLTSWSTPRSTRSRAIGEFERKVLLALFIGGS